jgi:hypothetical protein
VGTDPKLNRFAPFLYTPNGVELVEKLWEETMVELEFVKPQSILSSLSTK